MRRTGVVATIPWRYMSVCVSSRFVLWTVTDNFRSKPDKCGSSSILSAKRWALLHGAAEVALVACNSTDIDWNRLFQNLAYAMSAMPCTCALVLRYQAQLLDWEIVHRSWAAQICDVDVYLLKLDSSPILDQSVNGPMLSLEGM